MAELTIEYLPITEILPYPKNARSHSRKQIRQIADSIERFGFTNPLLIDNKNMILAGHGRLSAAKVLQLSEVPCVRLANMTQAQKRAYILVDNKLALNAGWDEELLAEELKGILDLGEIDVGVTGFSIAEVDSLISNMVVEEDNNPDDDVLPAKPPARCKRGEIWQLGAHRLICGDAQDPATIDRLMAGAKARMVFTDPPYNMPIRGHVSGLGKVKHREFAQASGEMSSAEFSAFLTQSFETLSRHSVDGAIHFICMDWRHMSEILAAGRDVYGDLKNLIVWVKDNGGMGTFYRSRHELIFAFKCGDAPHINSFELGQFGRYRTNVWQYKGVNTLKAGRAEELAMHPTVKPVQMIVDAIKDVSARGDIVLDVFGGSGSTMIAAQRTGRRAYMCELDPIYCDCIIARYEAFAKDEAFRLNEELHSEAT